MNDALNDVRAAESRRLVQDGYEPVLTKTRWCEKWFDKFEQ